MSRSWRFSVTNKVRRYVELVHISDLRLICLFFDLSKWESKRARNWLLLVKALAGMAYIRDQSTRTPCPLHFLFNSLIKATKMTQNLGKNWKWDADPSFPQVKDEGRVQGPKCTIPPILSSNVFLWGIYIFRLFIQQRSCHLSVLDDFVGFSLSTLNWKNAAGYVIRMHFIKNIEVI